MRRHQNATRPGKVIGAALLMLSPAFAASSGATSIRYVNVSAAPGGNGQSWGTAYIGLQDALAEAASGGVDQIWVAKGTYRPAAAGGSRLATFQLVNSVAVYGGFAGTESAIEQRNVAGNPTVLSGDLNGDDGANFANNGENSFHVITGPTAGATAVLDGFTISGGNVNGSGSGSGFGGGGVYCNSGSPTIRNCAISGNYSLIRGAGALVLNGSPTFEACVFADNSGSLQGGALCSMIEGDPTLIHCTFRNNRATRGGAYYSQITNGTFLGCTFEQNTASQNGGAVYAVHAGIMFEDCTFDSNTAPDLSGVGGYGGAVYDDFGGSTFNGCTFVSNSSASRSGGAIFESFSSSQIISCEFDLNSAGFGGALYNHESTTTVSDCVFSGNFALYTGGTVHSYLGGSLYVTCSFLGGWVQGGDGHAGAVSDDQSNSLYSDCYFEGNSSGPGSSGGAVWENSTSSTFVSCEFDSNQAAYGGAISEWYSTILVSDCTFNDNESQINGGALDNFHGAPVYSICSFNSNRAPNPDPGGYGGAAHDYISSASYLGCGFLGNHADVSGGAAFEYQSSSMFEECEFSDNDADYAGGLYNSMSTTVITDCVFQTNVAHLYGGASVNYEGAPVFDGCILLSNTAVEGGGVSNYTQTAASFLDCEFRSNVASHFAGGALNSLSMPYYHGCLFESNTVTQPDPYGFGGGMYNYYNSGRIVDCHYRYNSANYSASGGGIFIYFGVNDLVDHCVFSNNIAGYGGGVFDDSSSGSEIANCGFFGNHAVTHSGGGLNSLGADSTVAGCVFSGNDSYFGGGVYCQGGSTATIVNCSLNGNVSHTSYGGGIDVDASAPSIFNSIVWGNTNTLGSGEEAQITLTSGATAALLSSCVQNWSGMLGGSGNFGLNPRFRNPAGADEFVGSEDDDLRLRLSSPAIDRGNNSLLPPDTFDLDGDGNVTEMIPLDADGQPRIVRGRSSVNVDLGAYEYHGEDLSGLIPAIVPGTPHVGPEFQWNVHASVNRVGGSANLAIRPHAGMETGAFSRNANPRSTEWLAAPPPVGDRPEAP